MIQLNKIYIDSGCNLCSSYGDFLKNRNSDLVLANQLDLESPDIFKDELVYERNNAKYYANEAIIESIYDLGSLFKAVKVLKLFPPRFSYSLYKLFAINRHRFNTKWILIKFYLIKYLNLLLSFHCLEQFMV